MTEEEILRGLSQDERTALRMFPLLTPADPVRWKSAITFGSLWRKLAKHWDALESMERCGIVERRVSRGETLWRPTKPLGLRIRQLLEEGAK